MEQKLLVTAVLTADGTPLPVATSDETRTATIRVEREYLDEETGAIHPSTITDTVRDRITAACELDATTADDYWSIQRLYRTDVPLSNQLQRYLTRPPGWTSTPTPPDGYTDWSIVLYPGRSNHPWHGSLVMPDELSSRLSQSRLAPFVVERWEAMVDVVVQDDPSLPELYIEEPLVAQERFVETALDAVGDIRAENSAQIIPADDTSATK